MKWRDIIMLILAVIFGFVGGTLANRGWLVKPDSYGVVAARQFELIDEVGRRTAFWGTDPVEHHAVLAFVGSKRDQNGVLHTQVATFGVNSADSPFLRFATKDGQTRAMLYLGAYERPTLAMGDEKFEGRLELGFIAGDAPSPEEEDWALVLNGPKAANPLASIGYFRDPVTKKLFGSINLRNKRDEGNLLH